MKLVTNIPILAFVLVLVAGATSTTFGQECMTDASPVVSIDAADCVVDCGTAFDTPHSAGYIGVKYDFPSAGQSTWFYCVENFDSADNNISHVSFAIPVCGASQFVAAGDWSNTGGTLGDLVAGDLSPDGTVQTGNDPPTLINPALKFPDPYEEGEIRQLYMTIDTNIVEIANFILGFKISDPGYNVNLPGPDIVNCEAIDELPVELGSFDAIVDDRDVLLTWTTLSETNNAGFSIERSEDGAEWTEIDFVQGVGTTLERVSYDYRLRDVGPGINRFRLKQVDFDGVFTYSAVVEVTVEVPGTHALSGAYPNPFNPAAQFTLVVSSSQNVRIDMFDVLGRLVDTLHDGQLNANEIRSFSIDAGSLPSGAYTIVAKGETFVDSRSVTLTK